MNDANGAAASSTVLVADHQPLLRDGLRNLFSAEPDLAVCGEAATAAELRRMAGELRPDLVILDFHLPGGNPFALLTELRSQPDPPQVLMFAGNDRADGEAERALRLGAAAFVSKRAYADDLLRIARQVLAGQVVLGDDVIQRLVRQRAGGHSNGNGDARRRVAR